MKNLKISTCLIFFLFLGTAQLVAQEKQTYVVLARPSHLIRTAPQIEAAAIDSRPGSIPYGGRIEVFGERLAADTIEGIPGHWRRVINTSGDIGYMFDGYLVELGRDLAPSNAYGFERHERKIDGLSYLQEENAAALQRLRRQNRQLRTLSILSLVLLALGLTVLYFLFERKHQKLLSGKVFQTDEGKLDLEAVAKKVSPKVSKSLDSKIKKISPNLIDLIQLQLKEFDKKISREYEKKSHVKRVIIERTDPDPEVGETAPSVKTEAAPQTGKLGFDEDTALFSAYLHKGYQRRFVELPRNQLFFGRKATTEINDKSVYELQVLESDPTRALFRLIDSPQVLEKALRFPHDYIYPVCEVYGNGDIHLAEQLEYSYGVAVKDGPNWRIIQKAKLRYYLNAQLQEEEIAERAWQPTGEDISKTYYAVAPKNDAFNLSAAAETFEPGEHVFRITITEQDKAYFELVEDAQSQLKAFHLPNKYLLPAFATLGQGSIYVAERAEVVQRGELKLENGQWKIAKKGIIQYYRDEA